MDVPRPNYLESPSFLASHGVNEIECSACLEALLESNNGFLKPRKENPFDESLPDPLCKLNLKETSDFVKALPMSNRGNDNRVLQLLDVSAAAQKKRDGVSSVTKRNSVEAPSTPGRPIFSFSVGNPSRKNFPSKWDDAEKWLITGTSCQDTPSHTHTHTHTHHHHHGSIKSKQGQSNGFVKPSSHQAEIFAEKSRVTEEKISKAMSFIHGPIVSLDHHTSARAFNEVSAPSDMPLKDKFTNEPNCMKFRCLEPTKERFIFGNSLEKSTTNATVEEAVHDEIKSRDIGTEMTPLGSSTTSRCPTPFKTFSPQRHNTPANRSGPLALLNSNSTIDIAELQECHFAKLQFGTQFDSVTPPNWSSREEEEEDISKSLRHFEMSNECRKSISETKACAWEEEEKIKCCLRYQREEAKIQAWVNLQNAKAEAQSKKLEVKIQKMRSNLEEKLMKRMAIVHRKAEELRAAAQHQHKEHVEKASEQAKKTMNRHQSSHLLNHGTCGCFPCNNHCH